MDPRQRVTRALAVALLALSLTGCTSTEVLDFLGGRGISIDQPTADAIAQKMVERPTTCHAAVDRYWPESSRAWAHKIVNRESGGRADAKNRSSSASGCGQLLSLHSARFRKLGYTWEHDRFDPCANVLVMLDLYNEQGSRPWSLTSY